MTHSNTVGQQLQQQKLVAILRGVSPAQTGPVLQALAEAGVTLIEFPIDHTAPDGAAAAAQKIKTAVSLYGTRFTVGCGTVLSESDLRTAAAAGAAFIVSPHTDAALIRATKEAGLFSMPGAYTPTEAVTAYAAGADMVKIFPAGVAGPAYIKALHGPLRHIPLCAVGGIEPEELAAFWEAGACAFGIGSRMVPTAVLAAEEYGAVRAKAAAYVAAVQALPAR